eukprot:1149169-Pelagomonas_calceolata.AAC.7
MFALAGTCNVSHMGDAAAVDMVLLFNFKKTLVSCLTTWSVESKEAVVPSYARVYMQLQSEVLSTKKHVMPSTHGCCWHERHGAHPDMHMQLHVQNRCCPP